MKVVELRRVELLTSSVQARRSSQLSYSPTFQRRFQIESRELISLIEEVNQDEILDLRFLVKLGRLGRSFSFQHYAISSRFNRDGDRALDPHLST